MFRSGTRVAAETPAVEWDLTDEEAAVHLYRYRQARHAGLLPDDAMEFAHSHTDVGELRRLVAAGCEPELIAAIVL
jgi:hypothetical protein